MRRTAPRTNERDAARGGRAPQRSEAGRREGYFFEPAAAFFASATIFAGARRTL